ncbi:hypothetical protein [Agrobacterium pusense]|uniref:hypothetical protein n=1 Tax=Agrobacterium pusense TaxID=648995 RepID=UPI002FDCDC60
MPEQTIDSTPEQQLLEAAKAILGYSGMSTFLNDNDPTSSYGIRTPDLLALKAAVDAISSREREASSYAAENELKVM